nr:DUF1501 domain-containing protein [Lutibaculum baratangense]
MSVPSFLAQDARLCPSRRAFLAGAGSLVAWANMPRAGFAGTADPRFVLVILRGAMDGLAAVPPVGDRDYAALRGDLALGADGSEILPLDDLFALNDAMPKLHRRMRKGEALIVHAAATPYRERSHFDGQDVLESGLVGPRGSQDGWLNRVAAALPAGDRARPTQGLAVGATVPLILRGDAPVLTWSPPSMKQAGSDTVQRLASLYGETDAELSRVFTAGVELDELAMGVPMDDAGEKRRNGLASSFIALAEGSGRLIAEDDGPRLAAISYDGWDTHAAEGAADGRLAVLLDALDSSLDALAGQLSAVWSQTVVAVVTEFGRTARANGNKGTDHGTATTAFLMGGAVKGGRVIADWPGLRTRDLYEERDLQPTTDLRAVLKGVLRDHLGIDQRTLATRIFPDSIGLKPLDGLIV